MSILTLFVVIPALMLLGLWLAKSLNQVRGVMVAGASCLLALSIWLTIYFIQQRAAGNTDVMLLAASTPWFKPLNIAYSVGVDGISVVILLLSSIIGFNCQEANVPVNTMILDNNSITTEIPSTPTE